VRRHTYTSHGGRPQARLLASRVGSSQIPVKLKALRVLGAVTPHACGSWQRAMRRHCSGPCQASIGFAGVHPQLGDGPAGMVRQAAREAAEVLLHLPTTKDVGGAAVALGLDALSVREPPGSGPAGASTQKDEVGVRAWLRRLVQRG
jgi:hypothetical protein